MTGTKGVTFDIPFDQPHNFNPRVSFQGDSTTSHRLIIQGLKNLRFGQSALALCRQTRAPPESTSLRSQALSTQWIYDVVRRIVSLDAYSTRPNRNRKRSAGKNISSPSSPTRLTISPRSPSNVAAPLRFNSFRITAAARISEVSRSKCFTVVNIVNAWSGSALSSG